MSVNDKELDNKYRLTHLRELGLVQLELLKRQLILEEELKFLKNSMDEDEHQENVYTILDEFANFSSELKKTRDMESFEKIAEKIDSKFGSMYVVGQGKSELLINPITGEVIESRMLEY